MTTKKWIAGAIGILIMTLFLPACSSSKTGCPAEEAQIKTNKRGELPTTRGKSNLFPKDMRKKMSK